MRAARVSLTTADRDALRQLSDFVQVMLRGTTGQLIANGGSYAARRVWNGLNVISRLLDDQAPRTPTAEDHQLACIRVGNSRGWAVTFESQGRVHFVRPSDTGGHLHAQADGLLLRDMPIDDIVEELLDRAVNAQRIRVVYDA